MNRRLLMATMMATLTTLMQTAQAGGRVALVIGNGTYVNAPRLANPTNDAADVAKALRSLGFIVIEALDLSKAEMDARLREFNNDLSGAEIGLFFYAGHGLQVSGQNYLVPIDAELINPGALETELVRLEVVERVMEAQTKQNVLFFDACRNNPFVRSLTVAAGARSAVAPGLALQTPGIGTLMSFSAQPGSVASDGKGRNSPFTGPLVRLIGTSNDDLVSLLMGVRKEVLASTAGKQVPWNQDSLLDKIYLRHNVDLKAPEVEHGGQVVPARGSRTRRSIWTHNDSELLLQASGDNRAFYYLKTSSQVSQAGVKPGTLLFEGKVEGIST